MNKNRVDGEKVADRICLCVLSGGYDFSEDPRVSQGPIFACFPLAAQPRRLLSEAKFKADHIFAGFMSTLQSDDQ